MHKISIAGQIFLHFYNEILLFVAGREIWFWGEVVTSTAVTFLAYPSKSDSRPKESYLSLVLVGYKSFLDNECWNYLL